MWNLQISTSAVNNNFMTKFTFYLVVTIFLITCNGRSNQREFDLKTDLPQFSNKMNNGDTLVVKLDGSICMSDNHEKGIFIKKNDSVYLTTHIQSVIFNDHKTLSQTNYITSKSDTLNYENFFQFLTKIKRPISKNPSIILEVIYKKDTLTFYAQSLGERLKILSYYVKIQGRIFPDENFYKPIPPPMPDTFIKIN